jgi:hypothetical protein
MAEIIEGNQPGEPGEDEVVVDLFEQNEDGGFAVDVNEQDVNEAEQEPQTQEPATDPEPEDEQIPAKLRGKTKREIAAIYQDLEREFGRRNNELGELRKITDDILRAQLSPKSDDASTEEEEISADDLLNDPVNAIRKVMQNDPERRKAAEQEARRRQQESLEAFKTEHPDAKDLMASPDFQSWLSKVPARQQRFLAADAQLDWNTANEIITTYKEVTQVVREDGNAKREQALADVQSPSAGAQAGGKKRVLLRKRDIWKLKETNPARFEKLQPVILKAYEEGRVID